MKMPTEQDRQAFFAQYWGQEVAFANAYGITIGLDIIKVSSDLKYIQYLELRDISQLTDEEWHNIIVNIYGQYYYHYTVEEIERHKQRAKESGWYYIDGYFGLVHQKCIDYLREIGVITGFRSWNTEEIKGFGWGIIGKDENIIN